MTNIQVVEISLNLYLNRKPWHLKKKPKYKYNIRNTECAKFKCTKHNVSKIILFSPTGCAVYLVLPIEQQIKLEWFHVYHFLRI